jgi:hypothetical protein
MRLEDGRKARVAPPCVGRRFERQRLRDGKSRLPRQLEQFVLVRSAPVRRQIGEWNHQVRGEYLSMSEHCFYAGIGNRKEHLDPLAAEELPELGNVSRAVRERVRG